jgi:hypothetical protein
MFKFRVLLETSKCCHTVFYKHPRVKAPFRGRQFESADAINMAVTALLRRLSTYRTAIDRLPR